MISASVFVGLGAFARGIVPHVAPPRGEPQGGASCDYSRFRNSTRSFCCAGDSFKSHTLLYCATRASSVGALPSWKYGGWCARPRNGVVRYALFVVRSA